MASFLPGSARERLNLKRLHWTGPAVLCGVVGPVSALDLELCVSGGVVGYHSPVNGVLYFNLLFSIIYEC